MKHQVGFHLHWKLTNRGEGCEIKFKYVSKEKVNSASEVTRNLRILLFPL